MKKINLFILLFFTACAINYAQTDSTMTAIRDNTLLTAEHTAKDNYDYFAVAISVFAFIVSIITLAFTYLTYKSQKKTEANTRTWDAKQERMNLRQIMQKLINDAIVLSRLATLKSSKHVFRIPQESVIEDMIIDLSDLHCDTYLGEGVSLRCLKELKLQIQIFNDDLKKTSERLNSFEYFFFHLFYFLSSAFLRRSCAVQK